MKSRIRYFVAVAQEQHFGRAAQKLHMSQPPLSQQIRLLEQELGVQLLIRTTRRVELTEAGKALYDGAKPALEQLDQAIVRAQRVHRGDAGLLRIGFVSTAAFQTLSDVLRAFREQYPDVTLELFHMTSLEQSAAFAARTIDVGLLREPPGGDVAFEVLDREPLMVALPARHPLARLKLVPVRDLKNVPFVMWSRQQSPAMAQTTMELCRRHGFQPTIALEVTNPHVMLSLVAGGVGAAIVPISRRSLRTASVAFRPLDDRHAHSPMGIAWRNDNPIDLVPRFVGLVRDMFARDGSALGKNGRRTARSHRPGHTPRVLRQTRR